MSDDTGKPFAAFDGVEIIKRPELTPACISFDAVYAQEMLDGLLEDLASKSEAEIREMPEKDIRRCRTDINLMSTALNDARKEIKRSYDEPLARFEEQVKALDAQIIAARKAYDDILGERDREYRDGKLAELSQEYRDFAPILAEAVPFERFLDRKWLNRSVSIKKAVGEMQSAVETAVNEYDTLKSMEGNLDYFPEDEGVFIETLSLKAALDHDRKRAEQVASIDRMKSMRSGELAYEPDAGDMIDDDEIAEIEASEPHDYPDGAHAYMVIFECSEETKRMILSGIAQFETYERYVIEVDPESVAEMIGALRKAKESR